LLARARFPLIILATLFVCLCAHEAGHVLAAVATGGSVTDITLFSLRPHVRIAGTASTAGEAIRAAGGSAWFLFLYAVAAITWRRPSGDWQIANYAMSLFAAVEILGWVTSSLAGQSVTGPNDASDFLEVSGANPYLVASVAAAIGVCVGLVVRGLERRRSGEIPTPGASEEVRALARGAAGGS
jgi:hypothetical protein